MNTGSEVIEKLNSEILPVIGQINKDINNKENGNNPTNIKTCIFILKQYGANTNDLENDFNTYRKNRLFSEFTKKDEIRYCKDLLKEIEEQLEIIETQIKYKIN